MKIVFTMGDRCGNITVDGVQRLKDLKVVDLKKELEQRGLNKYGNKKELIQRLSIFEESRQRSSSAKAKQETPNQWIEEDSNLSNDFIRDYFRSQKALFQEHKQHRSQLGECGAPASVSPAPHVEKSSSQHTGDATTSETSPQTQIIPPEIELDKTKGVKLTIRKNYDTTTESTVSTSPEIAALTSLQKTPPSQESVQPKIRPPTYHRSRRKRPVYIESSPTPTKPPASNEAKEEELHSKCESKKDIQQSSLKVASLKIKITEPVEKQLTSKLKVELSKLPKTCLDILDHSLGKLTEPVCMSPQNAEISSSVGDGSPKPSKDSPKSHTDIKTTEAKLTSPSGSSKVFLSQASSDLDQKLSKVCEKVDFKAHRRKESILEANVNSLKQNKEPLKKLSDKKTVNKSIEQELAEDDILKRGFEEPVPKPLIEGIFIPQQPPQILVHGKPSKKKTKNFLNNLSNVTSKPLRKSSRVTENLTKPPHTFDCSANISGQSSSSHEDETFCSKKDEIVSKKDSFESLKQQIELPLHIEKFPSEKNEVTSTSELAEAMSRSSAQLDQSSSKLPDVSYSTPVLDTHMIIKGHMNKDIIPDSRTCISLQGSKLLLEKGEGPESISNITDKKVENLTVGTPLKVRRNSYLIKNLIEEPDPDVEDAKHDNILSERQSSSNCPQLIGDCNMTSRDKDQDVHTLVPMVPSIVIDANLEQNPSKTTELEVEKPLIPCLDILGEAALAADIEDSSAVVKTDTVEVPNIIGGAILDCPIAGFHNIGAVSHLVDVPTMKLEKNNSSNLVVLADKNLPSEIFLESTSDEQSQQDLSQETNQMELTNANNLVEATVISEASKLESKELPLASTMETTQQKQCDPVGSPILKSKGFESGTLMEQNYNILNVEELGVEVSPDRTPVQKEHTEHNVVVTRKLSQEEYSYANDNDKISASVCALDEAQAVQIDTKTQSHEESVLKKVKASNSSDFCAESLPENSVGAPTGSTQTDEICTKVEQQNSAVTDPEPHAIEHANIEKHSAQLPSGICQKTKEDSTKLSVTQCDENVKDIIREPNCIYNIEGTPKSIEFKDSSTDLNVHSLSYTDEPTPMQPASEVLNECISSSHAVQGKHLPIVESENTLVHSLLNKFSETHSVDLPDNRDEVDQADLHCKLDAATTKQRISQPVSKKHLKPYVEPQSETGIIQDTNKTLCVIQTPVCEPPVNIPSPSPRVVDVKKIANICAKLAKRLEPTKLATSSDKIFTSLGCESSVLKLVPEPRTEELFAPVASANVDLVLKDEVTTTLQSFAPSSSVVKLDAELIKPAEEIQLKTACLIESQTVLKQSQALMSLTADYSSEPEIDSETDQRISDAYTDSDSSPSRMGRRRKSAAVQEVAPESPKDTNGKHEEEPVSRGMVTRRRSRSRSVDQEEIVVRKSTRQTRQTTPSKCQDSSANEPAESDSSSSKKLDIIMELNESIDTLSEETSAAKVEAKVEAKVDIPATPTSVKEETKSSRSSTRRESSSRRSEKDKKSDRKRSRSPRRKSRRSSDKRRSKHRSRSSSQSSEEVTKPKKDRSPEKKSSDKRARNSASPHPQESPLKKVTPAKIEAPEKEKEVPTKEQEIVKVDVPQVVETPIEEESTAATVEPVEKIEQDKAAPQDSSSPSKSMNKPENKEASVEKEEPQPAVVQETPNTAPPTVEEAAPEKKTETTPFKSARTVSLHHSKTSEEPPQSKKRKWGSSVETKQSLEISSASLKSLLPDVKPLASDELKLEAESDFSDAEKEEETAPLESKPIELVEKKQETARNEPKEKPSRESQMHADDAAEKPKRQRIVYSSPPRKRKAPNHEVDNEARVQLKPVTNIVGRPIVAPARNPTSCVVIVQNLVRPFTIKQLKDLLQRTGKLVDNGFWIDNIKSKCLAMYENEDQSTETRIALHGVRWPTINPKNLHVDFASEGELKKKLSETPHLNPIIVEEPRLAKRKVEGPVREWDLAKMGEKSPGDREREREKQKRDREEERGRDKERHQRETSLEPERAPRKAPKVRSLDELFKKTKAQPAIYWLPLTAQQITEKEAQRRKRMAESARVLAEINAEEERQRVEREKQRQKRREDREKERDERKRSRSRSRRRSRSPRRTRRSASRDSRSSRRRSRSRSRGRS